MSSTSFNLMCSLSCSGKSKGGFKIFHTNAIYTKSSSKNNSFGFGKIQGSKTWHAQTCQPLNSQFLFESCHLVKELKEKAQQQCFCDNTDSKQMICGLCKAVGRVLLNNFRPGGQRADTKLVWAHDTDHTQRPERPLNTQSRPQKWIQSQKQRKTVQAFFTVCVNNDTPLLQLVPSLLLHVFKARTQGTGEKNRPVSQCEASSDCFYSQYFTVLSSP